MKLGIKVVNKIDIPEISKREWFEVGGRSEKSDTQMDVGFPLFVLTTRNFTY